MQCNAMQCNAIQIQYNVPVGKFVWQQNNITNIKTLQHCILYCYGKKGTKKSSINPAGIAITSEGSRDG